MKYLVADSLFPCLFYLPAFFLHPFKCLKVSAGDCKPLMALPNSAMPVTFRWIADPPGWLWLDSHLDGGILQAQSLFICTAGPCCCCCCCGQAGTSHLPTSPTHLLINSHPSFAGHALKGGWECHYQDTSLLSKCQQSRGIASPPSKSNRATGLGAV